MGYEEYTDMKLLRLLKLADRAAYTEIYNRYWKKLLLITWNHTKNELVTKNIVQKVFTELWRLSSSVANLSMFLAAAVKYQIYNYYWKQQHLSDLEKENTPFSENDNNEALIDAGLLESLSEN